LCKKPIVGTRPHEPDRADLAARNSLIVVSTFIVISTCDLNGSTTTKPTTLEVIY